MPGEICLKGHNLGLLQVEEVGEVDDKFFINQNRMKMIKNLTKYFYFGVIINVMILLQGCQPGGAEYVSDLDVVVTNFDDTYDFGSVTTYALPDEIIEIGDERPGDDTPEFMDPEFADPILSQIEENMNNYGWTRVNEEDNPDVVILPSYTTLTTIFYYYDYGYWCWWYPWYCNGGGWWYPYPPVTTGYTTGTLLVQLTPLGDSQFNDIIPVYWTMVVNGLLQGSNSSIISRINTSIDQGFEQSPYLNK
ncbi:DUF4136 domain-containing protein [Mangrovivirga cuniculi]|uniref:DUF4136 domain-containing protein n=1 Tax=Mangrovivirga cuniculi TaxID=2715131 RepID=A0A4D7JH24_9BACT|nr:DUF4136 domain-containing protein [Mangrovivirga cuniculi]QCK15399.1 DUF4136 domain-containing protein [Mangrovivirga cuniculi]